MDYLKNLAQSLLKLNELETISKYSTTLVRD